MAFFLFLFAVVMASLSAKLDPLKKFGRIDVYFTWTAMIIVISHLLTWKGAVASMSSSVLFTFAFADATACALTNSGAVGVMSDVITACAGGQKWAVLVLLFLILSVVTNFINNNTTSILFRECAFQLAVANGTTEYLV